MKLLAMGTGNAQLLGTLWARDQRARFDKVKKGQDETTLGRCNAPHIVKFEVTPGRDQGANGTV